MKNNITTKRNCVQRILTTRGAQEHPLPVAAVYSRDVAMAASCLLALDRTNERNSK